jgi:hypothetical protein
MSEIRGQNTEVRNQMSEIRIMTAKLLSSNIDTIILAVVTVCITRINITF